MPDLKDRLLLTEAECADAIAMSRSFLRQARSNGVMPGRTTPPKHLKLNGRAVRYRVQDVLAWLEQQSNANA